MYGGFKCVAESKSCGNGKIYWLVEDRRCWITTTKCLSKNLIKIWKFINLSTLAYRFFCSQSHPASVITSTFLFFWRNRFSLSKKVYLPLTTTILTLFTIEFSWSWCFTHCTNGVCINVLNRLFDVILNFLNTCGWCWISHRNKSSPVWFYEVLHFLATATCSFTLSLKSLISLGVCFLRSRLGISFVLLKAFVPRIVSFASPPPLTDRTWICAPKQPIPTT